MASINFDEEDDEEKTDNTKSACENGSEPSHVTSEISTPPLAKSKFGSACHNPALALAVSMQNRQNYPRYK